MEHLSIRFLLLAAYVVAVPLAAGFCGVLAWRMALRFRRASVWRLRRSALAVLAAVAAAATIEAQKRTGTNGFTPETGTAGVSSPSNVPHAGPAQGEAADAMRFSAMEAHTNGTVVLSAVWPPDLLNEGITLDLLSATSLAHSAWTWLDSRVIAGGETNWTFVVPVAGDACFYKIAVRDHMPCMEDPDGDGLPNVYEIENGTNPWTPDYGSAPRIIAGGTGADGVPDLAAALSASEAYSIIEVSSGIHSGSGWTGLHLPAHPVLITSPDGGRSRAATLRHTAQMAAFYLSATQRTDTVVQGLNIDLLAADGQQMGFWCGGNLPWSGPPAAGTFRNISLRMPNPGVRYFGWFFRHWESNEVVIAASAINASGATDVRGIYAVDSPPMSVENCTFANFPPGEGGTLGYGIQYETTPANWGDAPDAIPLEIVNCLFDASFTNAYALAPLEQGVAYDVTMANCLVPSPLAYLPDHEHGTMVADAMMSWSGHLLPGSPAIGAGITAIYSSFDIDGLPRDGHPDIGADEYVLDTVRDTDGDGLTDAYEIDTGIDPYRADSDFDGVDDAAEVVDGTDPADPHSFLQRLIVSVTNTVPPSRTVYVAWGWSASGWETNGLASFPAGSGDAAYTNASSQGAAYVKACCDMDGDGECNPANDILLARPIPHGHTAHVSFVFGDVDGDGVADAQECADGTDPYDPGNYCYGMSAEVAGVFHTTNMLSLAATFGADTILGPFAVETNRLAMDFGTLTATNGERVTLTFWDDANSNGVCEAAETSFCRELPVTNRFNSVSFRLPYGRFDADGNGLLDWWEASTGLAAHDGPNGELDDTDGDGLINLHECWAGCDPLTPDGSNTLLSVMARSVDDRLKGKSASTMTKARFLNYNATCVQHGFRSNTNCWAHGIDLSCVSPWNSWQGARQAGTAITKRHLLFARHYLWSSSGEIYFHDENDNIHTNRLVATNASHQVDITIGLLQYDLPDAIHPARILPYSYQDAIGNGRGLPILSLDQEEHVIVHDLAQLGPSVNGMIPVASNRYDFSEEIIVGDSGNPRFLVASNEVILLNAFLSGGAGHGPSIAYYKTHVQQLMDELSLANSLDTNLYQLAEFPLK